MKVDCDLLWEMLASGWDHQSEPMASGGARTEVGTGGKEQPGPSPTPKELHVLRVPPTPKWSGCEGGGWRAGSMGHSMRLNASSTRSAEGRNGGGQEWGQRVDLQLKKNPGLLTKPQSPQRACLRGQSQPRGSFWISLTHGKMDVQMKCCFVFPLGLVILWRRVRECLGE